MICQIFRQEFGKVYNKYYKPKRNKLGIVDKAVIINNIKKRTDQL